MFSIGQKPIFNHFPIVKPYYDLGHHRLKQVVPKVADAAWDFILGHNKATYRLYSNGVIICWVMMKLSKDDVVYQYYIYEDKTQSWKEYHCLRGENWLNEKL